MKINKHLILNLLQKTSKSVLVGLSLLVLTLGVYSSINGGLLQRGPAMVIADDFGGDSNGGGCCDNSSNTDNSSSSDNGSNQNNSKRSFRGSDCFGKRSRKTAHDPLPGSIR